MSTQIIDLGPDSAVLRFVAGDPVYVRFEYGAPTTGKAFTAGIIDCQGNEIQAFSCVNANNTLGYIDMTLTETLSAALQSNGKKSLNYTWYFKETGAKLLVQGPLDMEYK